MGQIEPLSKAHQQSVGRNDLLNSLIVLLVALQGGKANNEIRADLNVGVGAPFHIFLRSLLGTPIIRRLMIGVRSKHELPSKIPSGAFN